MFLNRIEPEKLFIYFTGFIITSVLVLIIASGGFVDEYGATKTLEAQGYTNVEITGWRPFAAGEDDTYSTGFRATAPNGDTVTGTVTKGLFFKGSTVRLD